VNINAGLKAAFNYKPGTYWIYRDSVSGMTDSFFVTDNEPSVSSTTPHDPREAVHTEIITISISDVNIAPVPANTTINQWTLSYSGVNMYLATDMLEYQPVTTYPFPSDSILSDYNSPADTGRFTNIYISYQVSGNTFANVGAINHRGYVDRSYTNQPNYTYNDWFCLSADAGFVKMIFNHPQDSSYRVWELQRYKIVK